MGFFGQTPITDRETSRPGSSPLVVVSRPLETSYPVTRATVLQGTTPTFGGISSLKSRIVADRAAFIRAGQVTVPLAPAGFNFFSDVRKDVEGGGQAVNIQTRPVIPDVTYAEKGGGDLSISTTVDFNPGNDGADRIIQTPTVAVPVAKMAGTKAQADRRITFSPFRMKIWEQKKGVPFNQAIADFQAMGDMQIPKGRYVFTFRLTPDPTGEYIAFTDGFTFEVNGKVQTLDKAAYDPKTGIFRVQVTVTENLLWLIPLGIAAAGALGYMFSQADDVLVQVDKIMLDSWVPIAAAGAAVALWFIVKGARK